LFLLIITGVVTLATYNFSFQTLLIKQYLKSLAKNLNTEISVTNIEVSLFQTVTLNDLYIEDLHHDTLLYINKLAIDIDEFSFKKKKIIVDDIVLTDCFFNLKNYKGEKGSNLTFIIDYFTPKDTTSSKSDWVFALNNVEIIKTKFDYDNENIEKELAGVDYNHVLLTYVDVSLSKIKLIEKGIDCQINRLKFFEQSGFQLDDFTCNFNISPAGIIAQQLKFSTPYSKVDGDVSFLTKEYADLASFINAVSIKSSLNSSKVDFKDICYFAPALNCLNKSIVVEGEVRGKINNMKGRNLALLFDDGTRFKGNIDITGLPEPEDMFLYVDVKELITTKERLESIPLYPFVEETFISLPDNFRQLGTIRYKGNFTGFYHDFVTYGNIKTRLGTITTDLSLKLTNGEPHYKGKIMSNHFDLGRFLEIPNEMGEITMNVQVDGKGFSKKEIDASLTGTINQIVIKGYDYNNVEVKVNFKNQLFNGFLAVVDENISFDFDGNIDFSKKIPAYHFSSNVENAKLAKLNLINSENKLRTRFSTQLNVNFIGNNSENIVGDVQLLNSRYVDDLDSTYIKETKISSNINERYRNISIQSSILDANLDGEFNFNEIIGFINNFFVRYIPSQIDAKHQITNIPHDIHFNVAFHSTTLISKLLLKGIIINDTTSLKGNYNAENKILTLNGKSNFIDAHGIKVDGFNFKAIADENELKIGVDATRIYQNDSLSIVNFNIESQLQKDSVLSIFQWKNNNQSQANDAKITIGTFFNGYTISTNSVFNSYATISNTLWTINTTNTIKIDSGIIAIKGLKISSAAQSILIDGQLSDNHDDQIDLLLKNFNLSSLKGVIPRDVVNVEGIIDGVASITKENNELLFTSDLNFDNFIINENLIGKGNIASVWNTAQKSLKLDGKFYRDYVPSIFFGGYYYPYEEEENLDLKLTLNQTKLKMFDIYTKEFVNILKGNASADISITGTLKKPKLNGSIILNDTEFIVKYLNTKYSTNLCHINVASDMISFDNVEFFDETKNKNKAIVNGTIYHRWFADWSIGIGIEMKNNFLALNTTEKDNNIYYGKAYVSGLVDIGLYKKQLRVDVDIKTEKNTTLNIPLANSTELVENNFIEFVVKDTNNLKVKKEGEVDLSNIEMNFDLEITPDAQVRLIFDDQIGDVMRSTGSGNLNLNISNDGDLNMYGNYYIKNGDYLFTLQNVINKRFDLQEGGSISWNGSPYNAEVSITAVYRLRARLYDLLINIDTSELYKKRIPVDLKLNMSNAMMNPDISFDIELPTADEDTKSKVRSVLYVSDKEENIQELNKQVFSLLVLNRFLPPPGSESTYASANVGSTTSSELLSNQLSNWLSKISNDFDIGVNYRPGDELSNQELELALSTQLFNDRLILDGNVGLSDRQNVSNEAQNTNNLLGDVSIEYKITKDGKLRIKAFNNSNQFSLENTNSSYTQGVGISYKEEYDTNKEFWQKLFSRFRRKTKK